MIRSLVRGSRAWRWASVAGSIPALVLVSLTGCNPKEAEQEFVPQSEQPPMLEYVVATIAPTQGNTVSGEVRFYNVEGGVRVVANLEGLTPGKHGFHIHEHGDCSAPDATSAGGHWNPSGAPHGAPEADNASRHAGDLGNIEADAEGKASLDRVDPILVFDDLAGHAVLVHANADDLASQPAGNAGPRVGCGVIAKPE